MEAGMNTLQVNIIKFTTLSQFCIQLPLQFETTMAYYFLQFAQSNRLCATFVKSCRPTFIFLNFVTEFFCHFFGRTSFRAVFSTAN